MTDFVNDKAAEVADLMKERLNIRGKDLAAKLRRTGRMMPRRVKHEARFLADASALVANPKLRKMVDDKRVTSAHQTCVDFLEEVDVADRRKGVILGILGSFAMVLIVVSGLVIWVLVWRGFV